MKRTFKSFMLLCLALILTAGVGMLRADKGDQKGPADASPPPGHQMMAPGMDDDGPMGGHGMMMQGELLKDVGLTADQQTKIETLNADHQKAVIVKSSEIKLAAVDLKTEMDKEKIDMAKITDLADKIGKARGEMAKLQIVHAGQIAAILTKEQRVKVEALMKDHRTKMMDRFMDQKDGKKGPGSMKGK